VGLNKSDRTLTILEFVHEIIFIVSNNLIFLMNNIIVSLGHGCFQNNKIIALHIVWGHWIAPNAS
jgi:hypothetical protein